MAWAVFVSAKRSLAAHKVKLVVPNLAQEYHVYHTDLYTNYIGHTQSHYMESFISCVLHDTSLSIIEAHWQRILQSFLSILLIIYGTMYSTCTLYYCIAGNCHDMIYCLWYTAKQSSKLFGSRHSASKQNVYDILFMIYCQTNDILFMIYCQTEFKALTDIPSVMSFEFCLVFCVHHWNDLDY